MLVQILIVILLAVIVVAPTQVVDLHREFQYTFITSFIASKSHNLSW